MTTGVYGRRKLYGCASCAKLVDDMRLTGTFLAFRQSLKVPVDEGVEEEVVELAMVDEINVEEADITGFEEDDDGGAAPQEPNADWHPEPQ